MPQAVPSRSRCRAPYAAPARFPVRRGARLDEVRNFIAVEQGRADLNGMYIKRKSVAERQKKAIADSLRRLEESALTASSASTEESQIRAKEAEMIARNSWSGPRPWNRKVSSS